MIRSSSRLFLVLALTVGGAAAAACGDGDGDKNNGGKGGGGSGLANGTKLSDLSEAQALALCKEVVSGDFGTTLSNGLCTFEGILAEQLGDESCETVRAECLKEDAIDCEADVKSGEFDVQACDITVGEYRACMDAYASAYEKLYKNITCDADLEGLGEQEELQVPEACLVVEEKCPGTLDGSEGEQLSQDESFASQARRFAFRARK